MDTVYLPILIGLYVVTRFIVIALHRLGGMK